MTEIRQRTHHASGTPWEVGWALGRAVGRRLAETIDRYIRTGPARHGAVDADELRRGALPWLRRLPQRYQEELEGMAEGSGVPLQRIAEWCFVEECVDSGCSAVVCTIDGRAWVARNNDLWAPEMWGYLTVREVEGRMPTAIFGLEAEVFAGTGINAARLWLHYNWLPVEDEPSPEMPTWPSFVWLREALETCTTIEEVEALLGKVDRDGGMLLFAVDGKADAFAVFECSCTDHVRRESEVACVVGTNHRLGSGDQEGPGQDLTPSQRRCRRLEALTRELCGRGAPVDAPRELIHVLADPGVEVRDEAYGTVYANVACPSEQAVWYTFGGYPAASRGAWRRVPWPWGH